MSLGIELRSDVQNGVSQVRTLSNLSPFLTSFVSGSPALCRMFTLFAAVVLLESLAASGSRAEDGPSFDCKKASTADEKTICANDDLASLDRIVSDGYQRLVSSLGAEGANKINSRNRQQFTNLLETDFQITPCHPRRHSILDDFL